SNVGSGLPLTTTSLQVLSNPASLSTRPSLIIAISPMARAPTMRIFSSIVPPFPGGVGSRRGGGDPSFGPTSSPCDQGLELPPELWEPGAVPPDAAAQLVERLLEPRAIRVALRLELADALLEPQLVPVRSFGFA